MRKKLLPIIVGLCMMPALTYSAEMKVSEDSSELQKSAAANSTKVSGVKTLKDQSTRPPMLVQPNMPTSRNGTWRFGVWRNSKSYWHKGMDFSGHSGGGSDSVLFSDNGTLTTKLPSNNAMAFKRRVNNDKIVMLHASKRAGVRVGSPVVAGDYALTMGGIGNDGTKSYAKHLHYEYHIPNSQSGRVRFLGVGGNVSSTTRGRGVTTHRDSAGQRTNFGGSGYLVTDPTPYLKNDVIYSAVDMNDPLLVQYLGNSARGQYNALYRPNPKLTLGSGARAATKQFANLPVFNDNMSAADIAAMSAGAVDASLYANGAGYDIDGQLLSQQMMASFISAYDGSDWGSLPPVAQTELASMTPQEVMTKIANQRFGNIEWERQLIKLSSKGLLTEYLLMSSEENYLRQQNHRMKNRIELQLASLNQSRLFEYNKKIEAMNIMARAESVPRIIDEELQQLPNGYYGTPSPSNIDLSNLPNDLNGLLDALLQAIAIGEAPSHDAYNNGTVCGSERVAYGQGGGKYKITQMTPIEILRHHTTSYSPPKQLYNRSRSNVVCANRIFASGFVQTTPERLSEILKTYPEYANKPYSAQNQIELAKKGLLLNTWRGDLKNFLRNGGDDKALKMAVYAMAGEWASIGVPAGLPRENKNRPTTNYVTFYGKGNAADKEATDMVWAIMTRIQQYHQNK